MNTPATRGIQIQDVFSDLNGVELEKGDKNKQLFELFDSPWSPLEKLSDLLSWMTHLEVREIGTYKEAEGIVIREKASPYPLLEDILDSYQKSLSQEGRKKAYIGPSATLDERRLRLRGGEFLHCDDNTRLWGPVFIGPNVHIRHSGAVLGYTIIGDGIKHGGKPKKGAGGVIGHNVAVRESILRPGVEIKANTGVYHSIIGQNVRIEQGTQIAYENFSHSLIRLRYIDGVELSTPIETGVRQLGAIIGDNSLIGINVSIQPGVIILPNSRVPSGTILRAGIYSPKYFR